MRASVLLLWVAVLLPVAVPSAGQEQNRILLFDDPKGPKGSNIDLTDYASREISATGKLDPTVLKPSLQIVKDAQAAGTLSAEDLKSPFTPEATRKIAGALGFRLLLRLSGRSTAEGVAADAQMERLSGRDAWASVAVITLEPYRPKGARPSLIEGIKAQVAVIVGKITGSQIKVATEDPVAVKVPPPGDKTGSPAAQTAPKTQAPAQPAAPPPNLDRAAAAAAQRNAYALAADRYRRDGDSANLIIVLRKAISDSPRDAGLRKELINAYLERGWNAAARDEASRAVLLLPEDPGLRRVLGEAYLKSGDPESALRELQAAIKANPKDVVSLVTMGDVYLASARSLEAEKAFLEAAQAEPRSALPHRRLARLYTDRGQYPEALKSLAVVRGSVKDEEADTLIPDFTAVFGILESSLTEVLTRIQSNRQAVTDGARNREQAFDFGVTQRKQAEAVTAFLDGMPSIPSLARIKDLYAQAAGFVVQAAEASLLFVESQDSKTDREASLLRLEATRALSEAAKRLKAVGKPSA